VNEKKPPARGTPPQPTGQEEDLPGDSLVEELFRRLQGDTGYPPPTRATVAAAVQAMQDLAVESPAGLNPGKSLAPCPSCGHQNRPGSNFCGKCGVPLREKQESLSEERNPNVPIDFDAAEAKGSHIYHHHYHHHYFQSGADLGRAGAMGVPQAAALESPLRDTARLRAAASGQPLSRAEAAVRALTKEWALACNTKQLDDLVNVYGNDALILRPNHPPVRGTAAIREFYFGVLDAGVGEVELETLRVDVAGDLSYEAGRYKMLVPVTVGKRREERGKYLMIVARQPNGEWKIVSDCFSSDLSLAATVETETVVKPMVPRKPP
jgi:ketosteroid isomerase-like protein